MISKHPLLKTVCTGLLIFSFILAPVSITTNDRYVSVNETEAFLGAGDPATMWLWLKEQVLDAIVWELINLVLEEIVKSVTDWVRSGFRGSPAFITDFGGFMGDVSDQAEMAFIDGTPLEDLCSPFKFQVQGGLDLRYGNTTRYKATCTLDDIVDNIDNFVDGDFYAGGWDGWAAMTMNEQNNIYGATFQAQAGMEAAIRTRSGKELAYLNFGSGFFGQEKCETLDGKKVCYRVTPGETVNESLNNALNIGNNRLELADEFNELFGALLSQLMKQVLGGGGGLAGFKATPARPAPTPEQARSINDAAEAAGREGAAEQQEAIGMLADAAEYCRNEFNRPLSDNLIQAGYSISGAGWTVNEEYEVTSPPIRMRTLQNQIDAYIANDCQEL